MGTPVERRPVGRMYRVFCSRAAAKSRSSCGQTSRRSRHHRVGVPGRLVGQQRGMDAADHDRHAPCPQLVGDRVGPQRRAGDGRDAHQVGVEVEVQRLDAFVLDRDLGVEFFGTRAASVVSVSGA